MTSHPLDMQDDPRIIDDSLWREVADTIEKLADLVYSDDRICDPIRRAEGIRYLTRLIAGAIPLTTECWDSDYPVLINFVTPFIQYGIPAADCCYHMAAVHGDHSYRMYGYKGTAKLFDVESRAGHTADLADWEFVDCRQTFKTDENGQIEIILSREHREGNWVRLAEGPGSIVFRQYYYDWNNEQPALMNIERIGAQYPPDPLTPQAMADRLELFMRWLKNVPAGCQMAASEYYEVDRSTLRFVHIPFAWGDLQYGKGTYRCDRDEAVIIEAEIPDMLYWGYQLTSHYWEALDWHLRQTSLNGHQAVVDDDGIFRAVIAHEDPGVANWLDAGDHAEGLITARYFLPGEAPAPRIRNVALSDLAQHLPANTHRISPEQRQENLRARARSMPRRLMY